MATDFEVEAVIEELNTAISDVADDTVRFTQQQSIEIYEGIISQSRSMVAMINDDIDREMEHDEDE